MFERGLDVRPGYLHRGLLGRQHRRQRSSCALSNDLYDLAKDKDSIPASKAVEIAFKVRSVQEYSVGAFSLCYEVYFFQVLQQYIVGKGPTASLKLQMKDIEADNREVKLQLRVLEGKLTSERLQRLQAESKNSTRGLYGKPLPVVKRRS